MNRAIRLMVTGTGLIVGAALLAWPAQATALAGDPKDDDSHHEEVVTDFLRGDLFPPPVGVI